MPFKSTLKKKNLLVGLIPPCLQYFLLSSPQDWFVSPPPALIQSHLRFIWTTEKWGLRDSSSFLSFLQLFSHFGGNNFKAQIQDLRYLEEGWLGSVHPEKSSTSVKLVRLWREGGFPGGSVVKESTCNIGNLGDAGSVPVGKMPWGRKRPLTPVFLPGKSRGERSLDGHTQWSHQESYTTERVSTHACKEWTLIIIIFNSD